MGLPPKLKIGLIVVLLLAFFVILNLTPAHKGVKNFFYLISSPIQKTFWAAGDSFSDFLESVFQGEKIKEENENLQLKIQQLVAENTSLQELKKENEILRQALEIGLEKDFELSFAKVIGKDLFQDSFTINKGKEDGLSSGLPVITQQKILVGKIGEVYENFSKVILVSDKESSFDVKIADREISGVAKGKGGLGLILDLLPWETEIKEGEQVITSSLGGVFPGGILVGSIKNVKKSDVKPFQTAEIRLATSLKELSNLFIITKF